MSDSTERREIPLESSILQPFHDLCEAMEDADLRERVEHLGRFAEARSNALMEENAKLKEELENRRWTDVNARMFIKRLSELSTEICDSHAEDKSYTKFSDCAKEAKTFLKKVDLGWIGTRSSGSQEYPMGLRMIPPLPPNPPSYPTYGATPPGNAFLPITSRTFYAYPPGGGMEIFPVEKPPFPR